MEFAGGWVVPAAVRVLRDLFFVIKTSKPVPRQFRDPAKMERLLARQLRQYATDDRGAVYDLRREGLNPRTLRTAADILGARPAGIAGFSATGSQFLPVARQVAQARIAADRAGAIGEVGDVAFGAWNVVRTLFPGQLGRLVGLGIIRPRIRFNDVGARLQGVDRETREHVGEQVVDELRDPKNWPRGPLRNRIRYPVPSGFRFRWNISGSQLNISNPAPYWRKVEGQGGYVARTIRRVLASRELNRQYGRVLKRNFRGRG